MRVRSGLEGDRVAFWERHPAHPGGEVLIAGAAWLEVGDTVEVQNALKDGRLVEIRTVKVQPRKAKR